LATRGYSIQVGAFSRVQNAANLSEALRLRDIDATYFLADDGLFKVRFGNFPTREAARSHADVLRKAGVIEAFYIVSPDDYAVTKGQRLGTSYVRSEIVKTAKSFLGVPYLWGGTSAATGFDCSGLTAATYHLNGLDLPRAAREQFLAGKPVERDELALGDLVFFANTQEEISHVGIFIGNGRFIHAPGQGKTIREDSLSDKYYSKWFRGGRSYL
jgi:cell wall-associated NlpC family hydrolase